MDGILARIRHRTSVERPVVQPPTVVAPTTTDSDSLPLLQEKDAPKQQNHFALGVVMLLPRTLCTSLKPRRLGGGRIALLVLVVVLLLPLFLHTASSTAAVLWRMTGARWFGTTVHPDTFAHVCKHHYLYNDTWGRMVAPYVDKLQVKHLVKSMLAAAAAEDEDNHHPNHNNETARSSSTVADLVKVAPVLAIYDQNNLSLFTPQVLQSLLQPYYIKPTHTSGGVARVANDTYRCFKKCHFDNFKPISPLDDKAFGTAKDNMNYSLSHRFTKKEPQYKYITHRIILEGRVPMDNVREFLWYTVNGHPVYAVVGCDLGGSGARNWAIYSAAFRELSGWTKSVDTCESFEKPRAFDQMLQAVRVLGKQLPRGIVRIDLFVDDFDVYFGEFTFTSGFCLRSDKRTLSGRLIYALLDGAIGPSQVTPEFVERLTNETPWYGANMHHHRLSYEAVTAYPTEKDLCNETNNAAACLHESQNAKFSSLRCILVQEKGVTALGQDKLPWMSVMMRGMDIPLVIGLAAALIVMVYNKMGDKPGGQIRNNAYFLLAVTVYNYLKPQCNSLVSPMSLFLRVIQRSFQAFVMVHPVEDRALLLAHFATYWLPVAAWRARTPRRMIFWWLIYQVVALGANEFYHHREEYGEIQCARIAFIYSTEQYAVDETIRKYILPPFFVYGYLLPKQFMCLLGLRDCSLCVSDFKTVYHKYY